MRGSWWHGDRYQWNRKCRDEGWNKGNRDEQRGVRDVTEKEWTWGWKGYSGGRRGGMDLSEIHRWSISNNHPWLLILHITLTTRPLILAATGATSSPLQPQEYPENIGMEFGSEGVELEVVSELPLEEGGRGFRVAFGGGIGWGARVEGVHGSVGDCWKGLGIGKTLKCFWNWKVVGVGKTLRHLWSGKEVVPWQFEWYFG